MSRLEFHIAQKTAQRDCLDYAARRLAARPGVVLEVGLGKGRSYSHLRARFPDQEILCFDRKDHTHPGWGPPPSGLILGDLAEVLADRALDARLAGRVLLAHLDLARGDEPGGRVHALVARRVTPWLQPGGLIVSDRPVAPGEVAGLIRVDPGGEVRHPDLFFLYAREETHQSGSGGTVPAG